ncbi:E3 ubiquitin-protein ligase TRIM39-like [Hypomesus transpacificus]|uniref:E3 ubiquitin-protein ligase TRIM39-like n=1 Tax=Hypomesus transpacificus TaxID=137520 RepID=UPI001F07CA54|nr:E3 ubiquitin-protein ligase TRIM39-like [Hypomesus transpacificus]
MSLCLCFCLHAECVWNAASQENLWRQQESLKRQREAVHFRLKKLTARQGEITKKSSDMRASIRRQYEEIQKVLEEDQRVTLTQMEMEERAAVLALDDLEETSCALIQEIEVDLSRISSELARTEEGGEEERREERVKEVLRGCDPGSIRLDEARAEQILSLTNNLLLLLRSQTPISKRLIRGYRSEVSLDPDTAHPKLVVSAQGDSVTYTDTWQELPDHPGRFDTTLNVISLQGFASGCHYWEVEVTGKTYWELGLTYLSIPRKGRAESCWLGRGRESWCVEFFDGEYTAWHAGVPYPLPITKRFSHIGVLCSFSTGLVAFLGGDNMMPLFSFCAGTFTDSLHLAMCPGHDHNSTNAKPLVICNATPPASAL